MDKRKENSPFFIEFKNNYGTATNSPSSPPSTLFCLRGQPQVKIKGHCHRQRSEGVDTKARRKLLIASVLCVLFMIAEIVGGVLSNSLAIATDAAHLLTDFASFMISLFAIWLAGRPSTQRMSFGWYRAEVIGAVVSVVMIWVITGILIYLAVLRIINKTYEVDAVIMLITSGLAILVNIIIGVQLHHHGHSHSGQQSSHSNTDRYSSTPPAALNILEKSNHTIDISKSTGEVTPGSNSVHSLSNRTEMEIRDINMAEHKQLNQSTTNASGLATTNSNNTQSNQNEQPGHGGRHFNTEGTSAQPKENINVRAAFIHVLGDVLQSIGVFIAALVIYFKPEWAIADPICTFLFSVIVLFTTFSIMKDALLVLMEGTPNYLQYTEVMSVFLQIEGVERVHNLRIWALSINKVALAAHLAIKPGANAKQILQDATSAVHVKYNFFETTIQIEDFSPEMEDCKQCLEPGK